jgi:hypothetical protein
MGALGKPEKFIQTKTSAAMQTAEVFVSPGLLAKAKNQITFTEHSIQ